MNNCQVSLRNEVLVLREINHPHTVKMFEVFENSKRIYLVFELIQGGELFERLKKKKTYAEEQAALVMKQLMEGLIYLEKKQIIHRDLKLENIMLVSQDNDHELKIVDFGLSTKIDKVDPNVRCGTPGYVAPEVIGGGRYDYKSDIFSCGVILYIL
jgi:serine/threonine protein kinase